MAVVEGKEDLLHDLGGIAFGERAGVDDTVKQLSSGTEFSYNVETTTLLEKVKYFDDVWMVLRKGMGIQCCGGSLSRS